MVDWLYTFTRTAETMIGGAFGALMYSIATEDRLATEDLALVAIVFLSAAILVTALYGWYEYQREEKFR